MSESFPWGDRDPVGGFKVGDHVGLIYSDHEEYIFDNPTGVITSIGDDGTVTVKVEATIDSDRVYLIERREA
jgi:hypothetical protein